MNIKEIRVGNIVHNNVEVMQLNKSDVIFLLTDDNDHYAEPIEITNEWLLKLGFELGSDIVGDCYFTYHNTNEEFCISSRKGIFNFGDMFDIKYIHELQNLYFLISKEELTIK